MPECAKAHLQQSRTSEFSGRTPRYPAFRVWVRKGRKTGKKRRARERRREEVGNRGWKGGKGRRGNGRVGREALPNKNLPLHRCFRDQLGSYQSRSHWPTEQHQHCSSRQITGL